MIEQLVSEIGKPDRFIVFSWKDCPDIIKEYCNLNGGDEDWVVIVPKKHKAGILEYLPSWISHTDSCYEPDVYELKNGYMIIVGSHA